MGNIQHKRGIRAALDALASGGGIVAGQLYHITDQDRLAVGKTGTTFAEYLSIDEAAGLNEPQTFTAAQGTTITPLTDSAIIATDASASNAFEVTLGGNRALASPTNIVAGRTYIWIIRQDATGGRTLAFGSVFKFASGTAPSLSTGANAIDRIVAFAASTTELIANAEKDFS